MKHQKLFFASLVIGSIILLAVVFREKEPNIMHGKAFSEPPLALSNPPLPVLSETAWKDQIIARSNQYATQYAKLNRPFPASISNYFVESMQMFITNKINDGTGRVAIADKTKVEVSMFDRNGNVLWTTGFTNCHGPYKLYVIKNHLHAHVEPSDDDVLLDVDTGKIIGHILNARNGIK